MYEHRDKVNVPVCFGVGAAFDLNSCQTSTSYLEWMREHGFEWLFRLLQDRRLWMVGGILVLRAGFLLNSP